jgi:hypothetical protein
MVVATDDTDIAILNDKTKEQLEKLPGKYWKIGIDGNTGHSCFRQAAGLAPADLELYAYYSSTSSQEGWYFGKSLDPKDRRQLYTQTVTTHPLYIVEPWCSMC